jgi:glycerophosphoryl diester phosphodiesterase
MWTFPRILAHRGGGVLAPENTMAALRKGYDMGFRGVEFDVMATRDEGLILMHDDYLGRTVAGAGSISDLTASELLAMDAGSWFSADHAGERIPLFAEAARYCVSSGIFMNVEVKPVPGQETRTAELVAQFCSVLPPGSVLLSSFSLDALKVVKQMAPSIPRAWLVDAVPDDCQQTLAMLDSDTVHANANNLDPSTVKALKAEGIKLLCYTVNDPVQARALFNAGVDALCTDRLDLIAPDFFDHRYIH